MYFAYLEVSTHGGHTDDVGTFQHAEHDHGGHDGYARYTRSEADWHAELGFMFGLTESTPDAALKSIWASISEAWQLRDCLLIAMPA